MRKLETPPLLDLGNAPKIFVNGLGRVTPMGGNAVFTFYTLRGTGRTNEAVQERLVEVELIAPVEAVGPAFDLALTSLGPRTVFTLAGGALSKAIRRHFVLN